MRLFSGVVSQNSTSHSHHLFLISLQRDLRLALKFSYLVLLCRSTVLTSPFDLRGTFVCLVNPVLLFACGWVICGVCAFYIENVY